jgi:predicted GIY-YIG superfamily endonuclease
MRTGIYTITSPSGLFYVGSALDVPTRWKSHKSALKHGKHSNRLLQAESDLYGADALKFEHVLSVIDRKFLFLYEQTVIDDRSPGLNLCKSVVRNSNGTHLTYGEAHKAILSRFGPIEHDRAKRRKARAQAAMDLMVKQAEDRDR